MKQLPEDALRDLTSVIDRERAAVGDSAIWNRTLAALSSTDRRHRDAIKPVLFRRLMLGTHAPPVPDGIVELVQDLRAWYDDAVDWSRLHSLRSLELWFSGEALPLARLQELPVTQLDRLYVAGESSAVHRFPPTSTVLAVETASVDMLSCIDWSALKRLCVMTRDIRGQDSLLPAAPRLRSLAIECRSRLEPTIERIDTLELHHLIVTSRYADSAVFEALLAKILGSAGQLQSLCLQIQTGIYQPWPETRVKQLFGALKSLQLERLCIVRRKSWRGSSLQDQVIDEWEDDLVPYAARFRSVTREIVFARGPLSQRRAFRLDSTGICELGADADCWEESWRQW